jgi:phytoene synthase
MMGELAEEDLVALSGRIIQSGSKSFAAAARLFDPRTRAGAYLLYAWCRHCDDVIDGQELGHHSHRTGPHDPFRALARLRAETISAMALEPTDDPVFVAFQRVVREFAIPARHPHELLDGFAMDVAGRRYETIEDTLDYCYHVAGVVGVMMSMVMGAREPDTLDRACDLGIAFQLTNIVRDIFDDAAAGRLYLPRAWLAEAGVPPEEIADLRHRAAVHAVAQRVLALADQYYASSRSGIARLPMRSAWAVSSARIVYREIGQEVRRRGPEAWSTRVSTSRTQKIGAVIRGAMSAIASRMPAYHGERDASLWTRPRG